MSTGANPTKIFNARTIEEPDVNASVANFYRNVVHELGVLAMKISSNNNEVSLEGYRSVEEKITIHNRDGSKGRLDGCCVVEERGHQRSRGQARVSNCVPPFVQSELTRPKHALLSLLTPLPPPLSDKCPSNSIPAHS